MCARITKRSKTIKLVFKAMNAAVMNCMEPHNMCKTKTSVIYFILKSVIWITTMFRTIT